MTGVKLTVAHGGNLRQVVWHRKGDYAATVAPQERGLEMQPEEKVTRARTHARTCRQPRCALADARTDARIGLHSTRTKHTLTRSLSHSRTHADTHVRAYT